MDTTDPGRTSPTCTSTNGEPAWTGPLPTICGPRVSRGRAGRAVRRSPASILPQLGDRRAVLFGQDLTRASAADPAGLTNSRSSSTGRPTRLALAGRGVLVEPAVYDERKRAGVRRHRPGRRPVHRTAPPFEPVGVIDVAKDSPIGPVRGHMLVAMDLGRRRGSCTPARRRAAGDRRVPRSTCSWARGRTSPRSSERVEAVVGTAGRRSARRRQNRKSTEEVIGGVKSVLNLCSLGALLVGLFLVYNALSVTVAERRHDIGVLRSLGATRGQIAGLFTVEAIGPRGPRVPARHPARASAWPDWPSRLFGEELSRSSWTPGTSGRAELATGAASRSWPGW